MVQRSVGTQGAFGLHQTFLRNENTIGVIFLPTPDSYRDSDGRREHFTKQLYLVIFIIMKILKKNNPV